MHHNQRIRCLFITETAKREQSRHQLFNYLARDLKKNNIELSILAFLESKDELILSESGLDIPVESIAKDLYKRTSFFKFIHYIFGFKPDCLLIGGYGYIECWLAILYSKLMRIPVTFWTGAGYVTTQNKSYLRDFLKKIFIKNIDSAVTYGSNASAYLKKLGMDSNKIEQGINVSNVAYFKDVLFNYLNSTNMRLNVNGLPRPILIFVGRLEPSKGLDLLLEQLRLLPKESYYCYFIGKGSLSGQIEKDIFNNKINGRLFGFLNQSEVAKRFVESDVYILPSLNDPFTRTLSEAISSGCFVLNSCYDDASYDLIKDGENGYIFDPKNFNEFKRYLDIITSESWSRPCRKEISNSLKFDQLDYSKQIIKAILKSLGKFKDHKA